jgi:hypothetical protein
VADNPECVTCFRTGGVCYDTTGDDHPIHADVGTTLEPLIPVILWPLAAMRLMVIHSKCCRKFPVDTSVTLAAGKSRNDLSRIDNRRCWSEFLRTDSAISILVLSIVGYFSAFCKNRTVFISVNIGPNLVLAYPDERCSADGLVKCVDVNSQCAHDGVLSVEFTCTCKTGYTSVQNPDNPDHKICGECVHNNVI